MKPYLSVRALLRVAALSAFFSSFVHLNAATPRAFFKADSLSISNGSAVNLWPDSSKNSNVAQQSGAGSPTFAATGMNGFPSVHFNGSQSMVFPRPVQDDFSIVVLFKTAAADGTSDSFYSGSALVSGERPGAVDDFGMSIRDNGRVLAGVGNPDTTINSNQNNDDGNPHIATFTRSRTSGALRLYVDRDLRRSVTASGRQALSVYSQLCLGAHPGPLGPFLNGDIAEVILYDSVLSQAEVLTTEESLRGKYGMSNGAVPQIPTTLKAEGYRLSWSESPGARTYKVLRSSSASGPFSKVAENLTNTEYLDTSAVGGQTYFYQVVAVNPIGSSASSVTVEAATLALPANGRVVINEIHYNGLNNTLHTDFIELFNFSNSPTDVSGWRLSSGVDFVFPAGTVLPAGGYLVVAEDPAMIQAVWEVSALGPYEKSLSSDGETLRLRNAADVVISELTYSSGFPWPCAANGEGASAELMNPNLDASKGSSWRSSINPTTDLTGEIATPGAQNLQFTLNPPPNIEQVSHPPSQPTSRLPVKVTARLSDENGSGTAQLSYQIVTPGNYIPAYLPLPIVNHNIDTSQPRPVNPAFESPANWTTIAMTDGGTDGDEVSGDGIYTASIPAQAHRTLVRYRVTATDGSGNSARAPFADDTSKNFAYYVYDGVPDYQGIPAATLKTLPVYQHLGRKADYDQAVAYNSADQLTGNTPGWTFENWGATIVFDGVVYDHIKFRLHGGNGRYKFTSKRGFRFFFNKGYHFQNRDQDGELMPTKWKSITTENCWENRETLTYCLNEMINFHLWNKIGIPAPLANWGHFRTVTTVDEQSDPWHGDFWGLIMIHEDYNGDFLDAHNMEKGNVYKLTRDATDGASQQRYQAPDAVGDGADHSNIYNNLVSNEGEAFIRRYVDVDKWSYYHALCQAVRHYDYWPTGDNNGAYYFAPDYTDQTDNLGKLWVMPNDVDATWGPTWNEGKDKVYSAIFDSPANAGLYPTYFNAVRDLRDILWQPDQINPVIDEFAAIIAPFIPADSIRWKGGPNEAGNYNGIGGKGATSLAALVTDMKNFAWTGGTWPGGDVGAGGRAAFLDTLQLGVSNSEGSTMPLKPSITYQGPTGHPVNQLKFNTSSFIDPQSVSDFAALQWRVAEVTDASAPSYDITDKFKLEWSADYISEELAAFSDSFTFPSTACKAGHAYRVRVRHKDITGRWSHWSDPLQFIASESTNSVAIVASEFLYRPPSVTAAESAAGFTDRDQFEFFEIRNVGTGTADLSGYKFTKGITFTFPTGSSLAPGASTVVVENAAAFAFRYGSGRPVAGTYSGKLANEGEQITFVNATAEPVFDFTYQVVAPWPADALSGSRSLVMKNPETLPDPSNGLNWRTSTRAGGAPGFADSASYSSWAAANSVSGDGAADEDSDGVPNALEYALLGDPHGFTTLPTPQIQPVLVATVESPYLTLSFRKRIDATDISYQVQYTNNLDSWDVTPILMNTMDHYDGTVTESWRTATPVAGKGFLRVRVAPAP